MCLVQSKNAPDGRMERYTVILSEVRDTASKEFRSWLVLLMERQEMRFWLFSNPLVIRTDRQQYRNWFAKELVQT